MDFVVSIWHCECVCGLIVTGVAAKYQRRHRKHGRHFSEEKALVVLRASTPRRTSPARWKYIAADISKRGSSALCKARFLVMSVILQCSPDDDLVYQFMDGRHTEGKPVHGDNTLFEMLILEGMQAGLAWITMLKKDIRAIKAGPPPKRAVPP